MPSSNCLACLSDYIIRWMQDIEDFKCILCKDSFLPPYALPYLLPCTHSLCTKCLHAAVAHHQTHIICPEDLESNSLSEIRTDTSSRRALERLVRQHKNYNQNNQLLCIQSLSKHFQTSLEQQESQRKDFLQLIDQIFRNQQQRLTMLQTRIHQELDSPFKVVKEWKESLRAYLETLKGVSRATNSSQIHAQLAYYIDQGRRIKQEINSFLDINYQEMASSLIVCSSACLCPDFTIKGLGKSKSQKNNQFSNDGKKLTKLPKNDMLVQQKISSNFSTSQSTKKKQNEPINKENIPQKRVTSQPLESKKYSTSNKQQQEVSSITSCIFKENKDRIMMNEAPTYRQNMLKEEVLHQLQINSRQASSSDAANLLIYSVSPEISLNRLHSPIIQYDELLLTEKEQQRKPWVLGNYNFLEECEVGHSSVSLSMQVKKRDAFNWQKESNNYVRRMSLMRVEEAYRNTFITANSLELINYSLQQVDISLYLQKFDWSSLQVVKLVKTNLTDCQLNELLNFAVNGRLQTLVLSGNCLSERALDALLNYLQVNTSLHSVYLSRNSVNCLKGHTRTKIGQLRQSGLNLYI